MAKITLNDVASGYNRQKINDNFTDIEAEFQDKILYRDNPTGEPNQMEQELDMNSNTIYNLPDAINDTEAVTLAQLNRQLQASSGGLIARLRETRKTATDGQTVFNLADIRYTPDVNNLQVYINGVAQVAGVDYLETDNTTITFTSGLEAGDAVDIYANDATTNTVANAQNVTYGQSSNVDEALDNRVIRVSSRTEMKAYDVPAGYQFSLEEGGRSGLFYVLSGDFSSEVSDDTEEGVYVAFNSDPAGSTKVAKRSTTQVVTPRCFGAVDGAPAQENAIEAFFAWAGRQGGEYRMAHDGDYTVSRGVVVEDCRFAKFESNSSLIIRAPDNTYIDENGITLLACDAGIWGSIEVRGNGIGSNGKNWRNGIVGKRIRRGEFQQFSGLYCRLFSTVITSNTDGTEPAGFPGANNNGTIISKIDGFLCGSRDGISIAFSESSRNYSANNPGQTSTLSVDLDDYFPTYARSTPFVYNGNVYAILSYDSGTNEAVVYPCLAADPDPLVSGNMLLLPGGGLVTAGADAGQLRTEQVNVRNSSCAVYLGSAYGGTTKGITSQLNAIDVIHGRPPSSVANAGETILSMYNEQETFYNFVSLQSANCSLDVSGMMDSDITHDVLTPLPQSRKAVGGGLLRLFGSSGEVGAKKWLGIPRVTTWRRGTPGQVNGIQNDQADCMAYPGGTIILSPDNTGRDYSFNLGINNANTRAFGDSGLDLVGLNFAAGNEITLVAPAGETVNGLSAATYTGLPANFHMFCGRVGISTWEMWLVALSDGSTYLAP